jgi:hypothetical protein
VASDMFSCGSPRAYHRQTGRKSPQDDRIWTMLVVNEGSPLPILGQNGSLFIRSIDCGQRGCAKEPLPFLS